MRYLLPSRSPSDRIGRRRELAAASDQDDLEPSIEFGLQEMGPPVDLDLPFNKTNFGSDIITDFEAGLGISDLIDFSAITEVSSLTEFTTASSIIDGNLIYDLGADGLNVLELTGTSIADLVEDDFIFGIVPA